MHAAWVPLLALALLAAGCTAPAGAPEAPAPAKPAVVVDADRPAPTFTEGIAAGPAAVDGEATLAAPPRLVPGEWWRIRTEPLGSPPVEFLRVVAAVQDGAYVVGMPHEGWLKEAVAYHSPAFGDVRADLSYDTHNVPFVPLKFPLAEGLTWETALAAQSLVATVHVVDEHVAEITFRVPEAEPQPTDTLFAALFGGFGFDGQAFVLTYDARMHEVVRFDSPFIVYEVLEHGYGFEGWVTVPRGMSTPIDVGGFAPEVLRTMTIPVDGGYNRLTLMQLVLGAQDGLYRVRTVAPDGTEAVTELFPGRGARIAFTEFTAPDGDWQVELLTGGLGFTYAMGLAYHQYDIQLPGGGVRSDHDHAVVR